MEYVLFPFIIDIGTREEGCYQRVLIIFDLFMAGML